MPIILNDDIFTGYGGQTGTTTPAQRLAAYSIAQEQIERYIGTFIVPTVVTGLFVSPYPDNRLLIKQSDLISVHRNIGLEDHPITGETTRTTGTAFVLSHENSVVEVYHPLAYCLPDRIELVYEAGLANGVFTGTQSYMFALTILAQMYLSQMTNILNPGNGAVTAREISSWSSMTHSETYSESTRTNTFFGETPLAKMVADLLSPLSRYRAIKLP